MNYPDNIFLIGFSGSGKSTIGPLLAKELNYEFYDTDSMIEEKAGMGITDIFVKGGELKFRKLEAAIIEEIIKNITIKKVVALGGGAFESDHNRDLFLKNGLVIYLKCSADIIIKRLAESDDRPLLQSINYTNRYEKIKQLLSTREPNYNKAHMTISALEKNTNKLIATILQEIKNYNEKNLG